MPGLPSFPGCSKIRPHHSHLQLYRWDRRAQKASPAHTDFQEIPDEKDNRDSEGHQVHRIREVSPDQLVNPASEDCLA